MLFGPLGEQLGILLPCGPALASHAWPSPAPPPPPLPPAGNVVQVHIPPTHLGFQVGEALQVGRGPA